MEALSFANFWIKISSDLGEATGRQIIEKVVSEGNKKETLNDSGLDSIHLVEIQMAISDLYEVDVDCEFFTESLTFEMLHTYVVEASNKKPAHT